MIDPTTPEGIEALIHWSPDEERRLDVVDWCNALPEELQWHGYVSISNVLSMRKFQNTKAGRRKFCKSLAAKLREYQRRHVVDSDKDSR